MNKKLIFYWIVLLCFGFVIGYLFKGGFLSFEGEIEKSYKTGDSEPRYIKEFKRTQIDLPQDNSQAIGITEEQIRQIEDSLNNAGLQAQHFSWFKDIQDEHVFLIVTDLGNLPFTLKIDKGEFLIRQGFDNSRKPTLIVPLELRDIKGLEEFFSDGEMTYEEQYKIYRILTIPALHALYDTDILYLPGDKTRTHFDNLIQLEIPPQKPVYYRDFPVTIQVTAANVDGQWLVFPGFQGDPDWKISLTLEQATQLYVMGIYEARQVGKNPLKILNLSKRFLQLMSNSIIYTRQDHKR